MRAGLRAHAYVRRNDMAMGDLREVTVVPAGVMSAGVAGGLPDVIVPHQTGVVTLGRAVRRCRVVRR